MPLQPLLKIWDGKCCLEYWRYMVLKSLPTQMESDSLRLPFKAQDKLHQRPSELGRFPTSKSVPFQGIKSPPPKNPNIPTSTHSNYPQRVEPHLSPSVP